MAGCCMRPAGECTGAQGLQGRRRGQQADCCECTAAQVGQLKLDSCVGQAEYYPASYSACKALVHKVPAREGEAEYGQSSSYQGLFAGVHRWRSQTSLLKSTWPCSAA